MANFDVGTIVAHLTLDAQPFQQGMQQANQVAGGLQQTLGATGQATTGLNQHLGHTGSAASSMGQGMAAAGAATAGAGSQMASFAKRAVGIAGVAAAVKSTVKVYGDFEQSLNRLQQVGGANAKTMEQVKVKAREVGKAVAGMSSTDAADAMLELAKGGLSVDQSMQAVAGTVNLAAAAQVSAANAAEIQSKALNTFGLSADQAGHVSDVLANTANAASGEITDFAQAMSQAGTPASQLGLTIDETAAALGLFANNGIAGSDAGTSLRTMLMRMNPTSKEAAAAMDTLGVKAFDASGEFVGLEEISGQLRAAQEKMTDQQFAAAAATAFGADAVRAAGILAKEGADGYDEMAEAVGRAGGAQEAAEANTKGLKGSIDAMKAAVEDAQLAIGEKLAPVITDLLDLITGVGVPVLGLLGDALGVVSTVVSPVVDAIGFLVDGLNSLPEPVQTAVLAFAGLTALKLTGAFSKIAGFVTAIPAKFKAATAAAGGFSGGLKSIAKFAAGGAAFAGLGFLIGEITSGFQEVNERMQAVTDTTDNLTQALIENNGQWSEQIKKQQIQAVQQSDTFKELTAAGMDYSVAMDLMTDAGDTAAEKQENFRRFMEQYIPIADDVSMSTIKVVSAYNDQADAATKTAQDALAYQKAQEKAAGSNEEVSKKVNAAADGLVEQADAFAEAAAASEDAAEKTDWKAEADDRAAQAQERHTKAVDEAEKALQAAKDKLTPMAEAAQDAADAQDDLADATDRVKAAMDRMNGIVPSVEDANRDLNGAIDSLVDGFTDEEGVVAKVNGIWDTHTKKIDTTTESGRKLYDGLDDLQTRMIAAGKAAYDHAVAEGRTKDAMKDAATAMNGSYQQALTLVTKLLGGNEKQAREVLKQYGLFPKNISTKIDADAKQAKQKQKEVEKKQKELAKSKATVQVFANTTLAMQKLNEVANKKLVDKHFTIYEQHSISYSGNRQYKTGAGTGFEADGHIVQAANGLVRDARIAPGGSNILWAEPETGWEAYIPGAPSKRDRSEDLLSEVAARFGGVYVRDVQPMASGGLPGAFALSGRTGRTPGEREGNIRGALGDVTAWLRDLQDTARDTADDLRDSKQAYTEARRDRDREAAEQARAVAEARAERRKGIAEANRDLERAQAERRKALNKAGNDLENAKGFSERAEALRDYDKANRESLREVNAARKALNKAQREGNATVREATAEQSKANRESAKKVAAAKREFQADLRARKAAQARASEAEDDLRRTRRARGLLVDLGRQIDTYNNRLAQSKDRLADLRGARADMRTNLRGSIAGFDSGILGHNEQRRTAGDIIRGLQYNNRQVAEFSADLTRAKRLGLSSSLLEQIASAGVSGGGITANALAGASRAQIEKINQLARQVNNSADRGARAVATATYNKQIAAATKDVAAYAKKLDRLNNLDTRIANAVARQFRSLTNQGLAVLVHKGEKELSRRG